MIIMDSGNVHFSVRSAGVAVHQGRVLMQTLKTDGFHTLPGGRMELGESASDTLRREIIEELGIEATVGRLLWVVENFFTFRDRRCQEILFLFELQLPPQMLSSTEPFEGVEGTMKILFEWLDIDSLKDREIYPEFLRFAVARIPDRVQHVVIRHPEPTATA